MKSFIIPAKIRPKNERYEAFVEFMENRGFYKNFNDYESLWQFGGRMATVKELSEAFLEFEKLTEK